MEDTKYHKGDTVQIKSTGEICTISDISQGISATYYMILREGKKYRYKEDDLIPYVDEEAAICDNIATGNFATADLYQKYVYYHLFSSSQDRNIHSYQGNKIIFNPFQYKPLMKFLATDSDERLLIADEVGVGKTIESGIILDELISRGELKATDTILIVCPNILCRKWKNELRNKFMIDDFQILDGKTLTYMLNDIKETGRSPIKRCIVSEQLFRGEKYQELLKECQAAIGEPFISFLIVDECHHYRNPGTNTHKFGSRISMCSERVIMLSATPFNLRKEDLYNQLKMLNPGLFSDYAVFTQLNNQIRLVNHCISLLRNNDAESHKKLLNCLMQIELLLGGALPVQEDLEQMKDALNVGKILSIAEIVRYENALNCLNPIASSFTRTLKRDAIDHRVTREVRTIEVHYTAAEAEIYNDFLETNLERYRMNGVSERAFGLILNGLERIATSSIVALERNIKHFVSLPKEDFVDDFSEVYGMNSKEASDFRGLLETDYKELLGKIHRLNGVDSKYDCFKRLISNIWTTFEDNRRIIVFSFYVGTLKYLRRRLIKDGYKVAIMYGSTPDETPKDKKDEDGFPVIGRNDVMTAFEKGEYEVLLVSEVGGEGLDFQFCTSLINYDLPYNPMRIEQRIGRIDRMGQKSDKIIVGNLCIRDTIDMVINRVLMSRIADATDLIGDLEPIIAKEMEEINHLIITKDFSEAELRKREREIEARIEIEKKTREEFDSMRYELVNDKGFKDVFEEQVKQSRISPAESVRFTVAFLKSINGCWSKIYSEDKIQMHLSKDLKEKIKSYYRRMNFGKVGDELIALTKDEDIVAYFNGNDAFANTSEIFFKPSGAWIRFMIDYIRDYEMEEMPNLFLATIMKTENVKLEKGQYFIFSYEMDNRGFSENRFTEYVMVNGDGTKLIRMSESLFEILVRTMSNAKKGTETFFEGYDKARFVADDEMERRKEAYKKDIVLKNNIKIDSRIAALKSISEVRIQNLENDMIGASEKEKERLNKGINREKKKLSNKVEILEKKKNFVSTYSFQALCVLKVV